jgi:hypothetical protein
MKRGENMKQEKPTKKGKYGDVDPVAACVWGYIAGFENGIMLSLLHSSKELQNQGVPKEKISATADFVLSQCAYGKLEYLDVYAKIQEFYADLRNRGIPLLVVVPLVCRHENKTITDMEMEEEVEKLRLIYSSQAQTEH